MPPLAIARALLLAATFGALVSPTTAFAFDYLEHSFFSDLACREAQARLAPLVAEDDRVAARYAALSLFCPERWDRPYCKGGFKQLEAGLNRLERPPAESGDHPVTLGDLAALPDHLADFGPVRSVPHASRDGLLRLAFLWLRRLGDAGGVVSDVGEDACETAEELPFPALVDRTSRAISGAFGPPPEDAALSPLRRGALVRGAEDPSGAYSFDNPQYLDLVLHNENHFGEATFRSWEGFHSTARDVADAPCEASLALEASDLATISKGLDGFETVAWGALPEGALREKGCRMLEARLLVRLTEWAERAEPSRVEPLRLFLERAKSEEPLRRLLVPAFEGALFEGAGLHFLQDGFSGGHLRLDRSALNLEDARYEHDEDGKRGVVATVRTAARAEPIVAWGDGFLLGRAAGSCGETAATDPDVNAACLLERQRAWVLASTTASLLDFAAPAPATARCTEATAPTDVFRCEHLPAGPLRAGARPGEEPRAALHASLPVPPPPFSYQSFLTSTSVDLAGGPPQLGMRAVFLSQLGARANWMSSFHFGVLTTLGVPIERQQVHGEFSYMFHFRWAARFLLNAGPFAYAGVRRFGSRPEGVAGFGPNVGLSVLPEGWIRLPLELTLSYRLPLTVLDGQTVRVRPEAHWLELCIGLAFM